MLQRIGGRAGKGGSKEMGDLRVRARLNDIERRLSSQKTQLVLTRWVFLPFMLAVLLAMVVGLILGIGDPGPVLGGIIGVAGGAAGFVTWAQRQDSEISHLEVDRDSLLRGHPALRPASFQRVGDEEGGRA